MRGQQISLKPLRIKQDKRKTDDQFQNYEGDKEEQFALQGNHELKVGESEIQECPAHYHQCCQRSFQTENEQEHGFNLEIFPET